MPIENSNTTAEKPKMTTFYGIFNINIKLLNELNSQNGVNLIDDELSAVCWQQYPHPSTSTETGFQDGGRPNRK